MELRSQTQAGTEPLVAADDDPPSAEGGRDQRRDPGAIDRERMTHGKGRPDGFRPRRPKSEDFQLRADRCHGARTNPVQSRVTAQILKPDNGDQRGVW